MKIIIFLLMLLSTLLFTGCADSLTETGFEESDTEEAENWMNETDDIYYVKWVYVNDESPDIIYVQSVTESRSYVDMVRQED